jgi:peptidoglycan/xylan/chitin deacetylase (PgdA/CDA1 family)
VALSFDDGPHPVHTPKVLDALARHGARATFFLIGERAAAYPDLVLRIRAEGHEVANHYYTGTTTLRADIHEFRELLLRTEEVLALGSSGKLFRPPSGVAWPTQLREARRLGYTCVLGSAYPFDPLRPPARYIRWLVGKNLAPGVVVILHDGIPDPTPTIEALDGILLAGHAKGLRFVTVGELLSTRGSRGGTP